jgi:hypothetical protein
MGNHIQLVIIHGGNSLAQYGAARLRRYVTWFTSAAGTRARKQTICRRAAVRKRDSPTRQRQGVPGVDLTEILPLAEILGDLSVYRLDIPV